MKNKIFYLATLMILLLVPTISAISNVHPESPVYEPDKSYDFMLDLEELNDTVWFKLSKDKLVILSREKVDYDKERNSYLVNIDDLSAGEYNYLWEKGNETNTTNISGNYEIEKATPKLNLSLNGKTEDLTVFRNETVNISIDSDVKGELELLIDGEVVLSKANASKLSSSEKFEDFKTYEITARFNENENYTPMQVIRKVDVVEPFYVELSDKNFSLGEEGYLLVHGEEGLEFELKVWLRSEKNPNFETLEKSEEFTIDNLNINKDGKLWQKIDFEKAFVAGDYRLDFILKESGVTHNVSYKVTNTIDISLSGKKDLEVDEEITLKASASGGISPYEYTWEFDGETESDDEVDLSFSSAGSHEVSLIVVDSRGNRKVKDFEIDVDRYYDLVVEVRDHENNVMEDADVQIVDLRKSDFTDSNGRVTFRLREDDYRLRVGGEGHSSRNQDIELDEDLSVTIRLDKIESSPSSTSDSTSPIFLQSPEAGASISREEVSFEAILSLEEEKTCSLLIAEKGSSWFADLAKKEDVKEGSLSFVEKLDDGEYSWQISCGDEDSEVRDLSVSASQESFSATTADDISDIIDAGELRRKIENANDNFNDLELEARRAADALNVEETLRVSLRDYERILRDINSLALRRDLSDVQKEERIEEYKDLIRELEKETPLLIELEKSEEFIAYPDSDELEEIASAYFENRNLQGGVNMREVERLQNLFRTRTFTAHLTITYLDGSTKDITLVHKTVEYTGETKRDQFLLESVPENLRSDLTVLQSHDSLIRNELLVLEKPDFITYYSVGHSSLDDVKKAHTLLLGGDAFSSSSSRSNIPSFTGMVTSRAGDVDHTTGLFLLLIILVLAYLFYAFNVKDKLFGFVNNFRSDRKMKELKVLINDAKDYLEIQNLERANLIYKEIKMLYENAPGKIKNQVYDDISLLVNLLNEKYIEYLINRVHASQKEGSVDDAIKTYNLLSDVFNKADVDIQKSFKDQVLLLGDELKKLK